MPNPRHNGRLQLPGEHVVPVDGLEPAVPLDVFCPVLEVADPLGAVLHQQLLKYMALVMFFFIALCILDVVAADTKFWPNFDQDPELCYKF